MISSTDFMLWTPERVTADDLADRLELIAAQLRDGFLAGESAPAAGGWWNVQRLAEEEED